MTRERLQLRCYDNTHPEYRGPFHLRVSLYTKERRWVGDVPEYVVDGSPVIFRLNHVAGYSIRITMNGDLAYAGRYDGEHEVDSIA